MRRAVVATALSVLTSCVAIAQTTPVSFEVASVKPVSTETRERERGREQIRTDPGSLMMSNVSLASAVRWAYGVQPFQVSGGPAWFPYGRFDISAKAPTAASEAELRAMLQKLLADRFKLNFHRESKQHTAYILMQAKNGTKCKESAGSGETVIQPTQSGRGVIRQAPVSRMVELLSQALQAPIVDETGLKGRYDCDPDFAPYMPQRGADGQFQIDMLGMIQTGLQEQFGLKLESKKVVVEILVIDHVEKTPIEN